LWILSELRVSGFLCITAICDIRSEWQYRAHSDDVINRIK
jgi:hypothetical protein